jgi:DNA repair exonuclease SbcCD ATPase subunit
MKEISRVKKLEVAQYYILGYPYSDIENRSGVSHGSIVNIVKELEYGKLTIPGTSFDQANDLRQLSFDLKKKGLEPSQALLGLLLFDRLRVLEITPEFVDKWSQLAKKLLPVDFPVKDFIEAALRLDELEKGEGKPFATLAAEYVRLEEGVAKLKLEVDSLVKNEEELIKKAGPLRSELESLERIKNRLENAVEIQTGRLNEQKSKTKETEEERSRLNRETKDLQRRRTKLSSEVDGREESLRRLNDIGLSDEDLLRITNFIERISKNEGISGNELKKKFLSALDLFKDITGLENRRKAEIQQLSELTKKESILSGEIDELNKKKGLLEGEIVGIISSTSQKVRAVGEDAASQIQQHVAGIKDQLNALLADALKAGKAIGEMRQALKKGEESEKSLSNFIEEVQNRLGRN